MEVLTAKCSKCKVKKELSKVHFPVNNAKRSGFDSWCRVCRRAKGRNSAYGRYRDVISDEALIHIKQHIKECTICGDVTKLVVDHDHTNKTFRGLICHHCNRGLGHFRDNPLLLQFAALYLYASVGGPEWEAYKEEYIGKK